jgi:hypothetical protein
MCYGTKFTYECGHPEWRITHPCSQLKMGGCPGCSYPYNANEKGFCVTCSSGKGYKRDDVYGNLDIYDDTKGKGKQPAGK